MKNPNNHKWVEKSLGDIIFEKNQGANTTTEKIKYSKKGIPVIRAKNIFPNKISFDDLVYVDQETYDRLAEQWKPKKNDVLYTNIGSQFGNASVVTTDDEFLIAWNVFRIKPNLDFVLSDFLSNLLNFNKKMIQTLNSSSTMPFVSGKELSRLIFLIPSISEQKSIVSPLSELNLKVENLQKQNQILEQTIQSVFKSWFIDFNGKTEFEDSELGQIPKGWGVVKIEDVIQLLYGKSLTKDSRKKGNIPVYGSSGIVGFHDEHLCPTSGIIVGRKGNVGSVFWSQNPFYAIDTVYYVKTELPLHYVYMDFKNQNFINSDSSVPGLSRNQAYSLPILIPDELSLERFENFASQTQLLIEKNQQNIITLKKIRDSLLLKLMSGELVN